MRLLSLIILMLLPVALMAQQKHFLYIQGENQQAFYVKMEGVIYSSSASGFIIIPRLENGVVDMTIGFPKAQWPEHSFSIEIKSADKGLILKNGLDKGWFMQDLQTQEMLSGSKIFVKKADTGTDKKKTDDPFASALADAISDPGIREVDLITTTVPQKTTVPVPPVVTTPPVVSQPVKEVSATQPSLSESKPSRETVKKEPVKEVQAIEDKPFVHHVEKIAESRKEKHLGLVYVDTNGDQSDTILVTIDFPEIKDSGIATIQPVLKDSPVTVLTEKMSHAEVPSTPVASPAALGTESSAATVVVAKPTAVPAKEQVQPEASAEVDYEKTAASVLPNRKDCKDIATEKDMVSARKKAYTLGADADMIRHYTKEVKSKCYTVGLLQSLSFAFVNDASRFQFFQEAYPWVMDPSNFPQLERLFVSKEFISRFRKLINAE